MFIELQDVAYVRHLQPAGCRLLRHLMDAGTWVTWDQLVEAMYGHQENGGPLTGEKTLAVHICRLRKTLKPGFYITNMWGQGFRLEVSEATLAKAALSKVAERLAA